MSDLISRQDAIKALGDAHFKNYGNAIMIIQDLSSAESERKWISCVEKLPDNGQTVLGWCGGRIDIVCFEQGISKETREKMQKGELNDPSVGVWSLSTGSQKTKRSSLYGRSDEWGNNLKPYCWVHEPMVYFGQDCKAWMPLPPMYEEGKNNDY